MTKRKKLLWAGAASLVLLIGIAFTVWWLLTDRPQVLMLPNGTKLTLLGVTYGLRHTPPENHGIPRRIRFTTPDSTLCVWLREESPKRPAPYGIFAFNEKGDYCIGQGVFRRYPLRNGTNIVTLFFDSFPRADGKMRLRPDAQGSTNFPGEFAISFPAQKIVADWKPTPLPDTEEAGDLSVTLTKLVYGVAGSPNQTTTNPVDKGVTATFDITDHGAAPSVWHVVRMESWDPTSNHSVSLPRDKRRTRNETIITYQPGLSPDAPAWKIRAELVRQSGFPDDETWTVGDIPVFTNGAPDSPAPPTNAVTQTSFEDSTLSVFPAIITSDPPQLQLRVTVSPPPPPELRLTLLSVTDENGKNIAVNNPNFIGPGGNYVYRIRRTDIKMLQIKLALHRSRFFEFIARPEKE